MAGPSRPTDVSRGRVSDGSGALRGARAALTALVVGSVLTGINWWDVFARGAVTPGVLLKVALTCAVPFCVTLWGALGGDPRGEP